MQVKVAEARQIFKSLVNVEARNCVAQLFIEGFRKRGTTDEAQLLFEFFLVGPAHRERSYVVLNCVLREKVLLEVASFAEIIWHHSVIFFAYANGDRIFHKFLVLNLLLDLVQSRLVVLHGLFLGSHRSSFAYL